MTSLPIYAFFIHLATVLTVCAILLFGKKRWVIRAAFFFTIITISLVTSLLSLSDYAIYAKIFKQVNTGTDFFVQLAVFPVEIGYLGLNYLVRPFTDNFDFIRIAIIFVVLAIKTTFLLHWGKSYLLSFLFYLAFIWYADSYLLRSSLAASIALIGFWALFGKRPAYQFFLPVIIASTFHVSALILLPIWWVRKVYISQKLGFFLLSLIIILGVFGVGHFIVGVIDWILPGDIQLVDRLVNYGDSKYGGSVGIVRVSVLIYVLVTAVYIYFGAIIARRVPCYDLVLCVLLFSLFLLLGLSDFEVLSDRLFRLTVFFFPIAIGHIFYCLQERYQVIFFIILVGFCNFFPYIEPGNITFL